MQEELSEIAEQASTESLIREVFPSEWNSLLPDRDSAVIAEEINGSGLDASRLIEHLKDKDISTYILHFVTTGRFLRRLERGESLSDIPQLRPGEELNDVTSQWPFEQRFGLQSNIHTTIDQFARLREVEPNADVENDARELEEESRNVLRLEQDLRTDPENHDKQLAYLKAKYELEKKYVEIKCGKMGAILETKGE